MQITGGTKLGPYEILSQIGAGGMGVVWQARDSRLDRLVAIKVLPSEYSANSQFRLRFEREAKAISSLNHPHICTLFDVGEDYLVMELLEGESLADRLSKGPLPIAQVLRYGAQIAQALDAAHRQGIVHRDLKPANVMLTRGGAKLLDFGLARSGIFAGSSASGGSVGFGATEHRPLTEEGTLLGTFQYMAPEQLEGAEADARTDIFALGALLYEMATGTRAFQGASRTALIAAIVSSEPPPMSTLIPVAPPAFDHLVKRCLQKEPDDRWQSAHDVAGELQWIGEAGSQAGVSPALTVRRKTRERLAWSFAAVLLLATSILAIHGRLTSSAPAGPVRTAVLPAEGVRLPITSDAPGSAVPSPDGTRVVYHGVDGEDRSSLFLHDLATGEVRALPRSENAQYAFWSPDSRWIGFFSQSESLMMKIDTAGGPPVRVAAALNGKGGSWNDAGEIVFARDYGSPLSVVSAMGGEPREVTRLDLTRHNSHRHPRFLSDGKRFLFFARSIQAGRESSVMLGSLDGSEPREIMQSATQVEYSPGFLLFERGQTLMVQRFNERRGELEGEALPLADDVLAVRGASYAAVAAAGKQFLLYHTATGQSARVLEWRDLENGDLVQTLGSAANYVGYGVVSPTGRYVAAGIATDGETDVWIIETSGGAMQRLPSVGEDLWPVWSANETSLVYASNPKGRFGLYRRNLDSAQSIETILETDDDLFPLALLPEGAGLLVQRVEPQSSVGESGSVDLLATGSDELVPLLARASLATLSSDGSRIAWMTRTGEGFDLFVATYPALTERRQITNGTLSFFWSPAAPILFYLNDRDRRKLFRLNIEDPVGAPARELTISGSPLGISPDGRRLLIVADPTELLSSTIHMIQNWQPH